ncbi:MAG TPA: DUF4087 domain-containing protein [Polyangiaceae bacterium]|nr:DUF4087 domain-containing protein [Polyangiaceae bacterium]
MSALSADRSPLRKARHAPARLIACALVAFAAASFVGPGGGVPQGYAAPTFETRCGWFENPTPANAWLTDRDGEWLISMQGGYHADGDWPPAFKRRQWVHTNGGSYGYGCACMHVSVDRAKKRVRKIASARPLELSACRADPALKEPGSAR